MRSTALVRRWRELRRICTRCKQPLPEVATHGGWSPHICVDRLRSEGFDFFLDRATIFISMLDHKLSQHTLYITSSMMGLLYMRLPPHEREVAKKILLNAGVDLTWPGETP